jgi:3-hydroxyacyl-CoA dehydrogenase
MLKKVAIIGSGTMGQGIAQWFIEQDSTEVYLVDQSEILK